MSALTKFLTDYSNYYDLYSYEINTNRRQAEDREDELRRLHGLMDLFYLAGKTENYTTALTHYQAMLYWLSIPEDEDEWLVVDADLRQFFGAPLIKQVGNKVISNTITATSIFDGIVGSQTFPANFFEANGTWNFKCAGFISGLNGNTSTINIKMGNVTLVTSTLTMPTTFTNTEFVAEYLLSCRTSGVTGTVWGQGHSIISAGVGQNTAYYRPLLMTTAATINTTISNVFDITYQWSVASTSNSLTITHAVFYPLK